MREVTVTLPSGKSTVVPYGKRTGELLIEEGYLKDPNNTIIGTLVNNEPTSLSFKIEINAEIRPITIESREGIRIYRRSLCFLLAFASRYIFPDRKLVIGHSLGDGYYYYFIDYLPVHESDLRRLEEKMRELSEEDLPIQRRVLSYTDALVLFEKSGQEDTRRLIEQRNTNKIPVYVCGDFTDLSHGPLAPNSGMIKTFEIKPYPNGFLLRYPSEQNLGKIEPFADSPLLFSVYQEYKAWGKILGVNSVSRLNELIEKNEIHSFIQVAEALHNKKISEIADRIYQRKGQVKVILIAGPSSSGKTTFTKKLGIQLRVLGFNPVIIELDNYFVPREKTPKDVNGEYDFESLHAIDVDLFNRNLLDLFEGKSADIPDFDFKSGERKSEYETLQLGDRSILLIEGIHGLNDELTPKISRDKKYLVYVSALTQLNLDDHNRISTTDNRLIRRMVRDSQFRGYSALETLTRWPSVRNGENKNIFPFQNNADSAFNSALDYELSVLRIYAEPLLKTVKPYHQLYSEAVRILSFLENFTPLPAKYVPPESILREFIGDSGFKY